MPSAESRGVGGGGDKLGGGGKGGGRVGGGGEGGDGAKGWAAARAAEEQAVAESGGGVVGVSRGSRLSQTTRKCCRTRPTLSQHF